MPKIGYWIIGIFLMLIFTTFMAMLRTRKKTPVIVKAPAPATQMSLESMPISAPPPPPEIVPVEKTLSAGEITLNAYPPNDDSGIAKISRAIAVLAMKDPLWVTDFREFGRLIDETGFCGSDAILPLIFGKPDAENVREGRRRIAGPNLSVSCNLRDLVYFNRILNPTTGKKEGLTICFVDGFFYKAEADSGNNYSR